ncbi:MAG: acyltransferase family protein [Clostridia bacterium]|nr:acyltransferase family protein [Clostridia bacterium]
MTPSPSSAIRSGRLWPLDLLRILAAFGVVVLHTTPLPDVLGGVHSAQWQAAVSLSILFRWCVPVFFMISGALFLSPERPFSMHRLYKKTILRISLSFLFWSALYALVHCLRTGKGKWTFLNQLVRGHYHMWYIFAILALYMLTPLVREMTKNRKMTQYFLLLGFVFTFLLPQLFSFLFLFPLPHEDVFASVRSAVTQLNPLSGIHALYYFVLGDYLSRSGIGKTLRRLLYLCGAAGCVLSIALTLWHCGAIGEISALFYDVSALPVLMMAASVFVFFRERFSAFDPSPRAARIVTELAACSFGVYLLHPLIMESMQLSMPCSPLLIPPAILAWALAVYLISLPLCMLLRRIPHLGKIIL